MGVFGCEAVRHGGMLLDTFHCGRENDIGRKLADAKTETVIHSQELGPVLDKMGNFRTSSGIWMNF